VCLPIWTGYVRTCPSDTACLSPADPRLTDYDLLLENIRDLRAGKAVEVPIYDFKQSKRTGYTRVPVPKSRVVIVEGIYALSSRIRSVCFKGSTTPLGHISGVP
jgi:Phosphoribulokinase / Uridine kinase family